ncbi:MAG: SufS family cysteine desulfurase [Chlamydiota bacterium]
MTNRSKVPFDAKKVRRDFPIFHRKMSGKPLVYLDTAATAQKPQAVIDAVCHYYSQGCGTVHRAVYELAACATQHYNEVREKVRRFLHASEEGEIIFTAGTTAALNLIALAAGRQWVKAGDEIIVSEMEHHSNLIPWQLLSEAKEATLRIVPIDDRGDLIVEAYDQMLSEKTKLVSLAHMGNVTGTINPVKELIAKAHAVGAKVILDGAQAAAQLPVDVADLDVDFYAFSGHKLYGPTGVGVLYGKREYLEELPAVFGGSDMVAHAALHESSFQPPPLKFESGTPAIASVIGLGAAIDYVELVGKESIFQWEQKLLNYALMAMREVTGVRIIGNPKKKGGLISFTVEELHSLDLATVLSLKGVAIRTGHLCASPLLRRFNVPSLNRISFGMYTTREDIDAFIMALKESVVLLHPEMSY